MKTVLGIIIGLICIGVGDSAHRFAPAAEEKDVSEVERLGFDVAGELKEAGVYILVLAAVAGLILREGVKEGLAPAIKEGFSELDKPLREGFERAVQQLPPVFQEWLKPSESARESDAKLAQKENLPPDLVVLASKGDTEQALEQLASRKGQLTEEQVIAMLIMSPQRSDHEQALSRLEKFPNSKATLYFRLGYKFWRDGDLQQAIRLTEKACRLAIESEPTGQDSPERARFIAKIKNSLAYFYGEEGDPNKADKAHRYVREALEIIPNGAEIIDTLGVVQIVFGQAKEEIDEGVKNCFRSAAADQDYEYFARWLGLAIERKKSLSPTRPDLASRQG